MSAEGADAGRVLDAVEGDAAAEPGGATAGLLGQTAVDLDGLMTVLAEHLYSTPHVVLRELVQNAHDSCVRRRLESAEPFEPVIRVTADPDAGTLTVEDDGAGMTAEELRGHLATIGAGHTASLRGAPGGEALVGCFGLGFLSAFVVGERVEVHTCSHREPGVAWVFASRGVRSYALRRGAPRPVGTRVTLTLAPRFGELARPRVVRALLERYCALLPLPIVEAHGGRVNGEPPPWRESGAPDVRRRALDTSFVRRLEPRHDPLQCFRVGGDGAADGPCRGLVWVHDDSPYGRLDHRRVWTFVRGMLVTDADRELLPAWAGFCGAIVESDALRPTASRESLQHDAVYDRAQEQLRETLVTGLVAVARDDRAGWSLLVRRHNEWLLGAAIADSRLFELLHPVLTVPTSEGDLCAREVLERSGGALHVGLAPRAGFEELVCRARRIPVVIGTRYGALRFCRLYAERVAGRFVRLGTDEADRTLFRPAEPDAARDASLRAWFGVPGVEVVASHFAPEHLPLVLVPDRMVELKRRLESDEADRRIAAGALRLARLYTEGIDGGAQSRLHVNLDCAAIRALLEAPVPLREHGVELLRALVSLSGEVSAAGGGYLPVEASLRLLCDTLERLLRGRAP